MNPRLRTLSLATLLTAMIICLIAISPSSATAQGTKKKGTKTTTAAVKGAIEIRKDKAEKFRFVVLNEEGKTLAQCTRGYETEADVKKAIADLKTLVAKTDGIEFAKNKAGKFRFSVKAADGKTLVMCPPAMSFETEADAKKMADAVKTIAMSATPTVKK